MEPLDTRNFSYLMWTLYVGGKCLYLSDWLPRALI